MMKMCKCAYRQDLTQYQRGRLPTRKDIPDEQLNHWGFPSRDIWIFRGYVNGAGRFQPIHPCVVCKKPIHDDEKGMIDVCDVEGCMDCVKMMEDAQ